MRGRIAALTVASAALLLTVAPEATAGGPEGPPPIEIRTATALVGPHRWTRLDVYCSAAETASCTGLIEVWGSPAPRGDNVAPFARHRFSIQGGSERQVHMRLSRLLFSRLKKEGPIPMFVKVFVNPYYEKPIEEVFFELRPSGH